MRRRVLTALAVGAILLALTVGTYQGLLARRPLPTIDGYYRLLGLHQRAEVTRDAFGIPRIEAGDLHDLFFLQGYVTAQDRFAQMEAMRQGPSLVLLDALPAGDLGVALEAYAEGVTKFIAQHAEARALPAEVALMPTSRAPTRFTAVARSALPSRVRSKKTYSSAISATEIPTIQSACPVSVIAPRSQRASEYGATRKPSAPKNSSPSPCSAKCTATATMNSTSTEALASGWKNSRQVIGPSGTTSAIESAICTASGGFCGASHTVSPMMTAGTAT